MSWVFVFQLLLLMVVLAVFILGVVNAIIERWHKERAILLKHQHEGYRNLKV